MAARSESSVTSPAPGWARRLPIDEKLFLWVVLASAVVMSAVTVGWLYLGDQNPPTASYRTTPEAFATKTQAFAARYQRSDGRVHVPIGTDAYLMAFRYGFYPTLVVKAGHPVQIWMSAIDALHGFSIVGHGLNINLQLAPNHAYGAVFTPTTPGKYLIVCNEYCGLNHHAMQAPFYVEK
jgi:cytochrome c oxidase subunit 2